MKYIEKIDDQETTINILVANKANVSMLKCSSSKIECDFKATISNLNTNKEKKELKIPEDIIKCAKIGLVTSNKI